MNRYVVKQTSGKRFLAGFLDVVFVFILSVFLYTPASAISTYAGWGETAYRLYYHGAKSGLYDTNELEGLNEIRDEERLPKVLFDFYVDHENNEGELERGYAPILVNGHEFNTAEDYYVVILGKGSDDTLFDFAAPRVNEYDIPSLAGNENAVKTFYVQEVMEAHTIFNKHPLIEPLYVSHYKYLFLTVIGTYLSAVLIIVILLPLVFKDKVSLGKIITSTIVVNSYGYKAKKSQSFLRNVAIFIFSYTFFFMPFHLISFFLALFSKDHASMYDRLAVTLVADKKRSLVFNNAHEEAVYRKKLAGQLLEIERRKQENKDKHGANIEVINPLD